MTYKIIQELTTSHHKMVLTQFDDLDKAEVFLNKYYRILLKRDPHTTIDGTKIISHSPVKRTITIVPAK